MTRLRTILDEAVADNGYSAKDLTVLAPQNDPYRIDTPARLDEHSLERAAGFCAELIERVDGQIGPELAPAQASSGERPAAARAWSRLSKWR